MMEDFHDSARRAGKVLAATVLVEAEARATGGGAVPPSSATPQEATVVGRPIGLGYSIGRDWRGRPVRLGYSTGSGRRGGRPVGLGYSTGRDRRGAVLSGSGAPLATSPPEPAVGERDRHPREPLTYPTHHMRAAQRAAVATRRKEHQGPPRPMKRGRI
jgi:hypothetical protein